MFKGSIGSLGFVPGLYAQTVTGSIVGSVQDPSGLAVPSAGVVLSQTATGAEWRTQTNDRGDYTFLKNPRYLQFVLRFRF